MVGVASWMGRSFGLHASAGARLALASRSDEDVRSILGPGPFHRYTARTVTSLDEYMKDIRRVRRTGVAVSVDELEEGLTTIAVPVGGLGPGFVFGVGVCGPTSRLGPARREQLLPMLRASAAGIDAALAAGAVRSRTKYPEIEVL
jgi:DNA-binding IclR family transcriptional regulator